MKKLLFLLLLTASLSVTASASNDQGGEIDLQEKSSHTFSLNTDFLSIFNLFCISPAPTDTLKQQVNAVATSPRSKDY